jgi:threonine/homoserine/homoserine lactone efflux protein
VIPPDDWLLFAGAALVMVLTLAGIAAWFARNPLWLSVQRYFMGAVLAALAVRLAFEPRHGA